MSSRTSDAERGKVLVIDDSWVLLESIRLALTSGGYEVRATADVESAAKHMSWAELVIIDFHMPDADGASVLRLLRREVPPEATCLFYLYTSDANVARGYEALGFDGGFLRKGDATALPPQVDAAFRTIKLKKLASTLRKTKTPGSSKPPHR